MPFLFCEECHNLLIQRVKKIVRDEAGEPIEDEQGNVLVVCECGANNYVSPSDLTLLGYRHKK